MIYSPLTQCCSFCKQMMEDAVHFLSKETVVQAIARSATKVSLAVYLLNPLFISSVLFHNLPNVTGYNVTVLLTVSYMYAFLSGKLLSLSCFVFFWIECLYCLSNCTCIYCGHETLCAQRCMLL